MTSWLSQCCYLYNTALEQRIIAYKQSGKFVSRYDQQIQLTELREDEYWSEVPVLVQRSALRRLELAYQAFFRRIKRGDTPGFPRFKSRNRYESFSVGLVKIKKDRVHIPKLGHVKMNLYRPLQGDILDVKIGRSSTGKWSVSFNVDLGEAPPKVEIGTQIGIDVGLTSFATLSDSTKIDNPRYLRKSANKLAKRQQALSKKTKGSTSHNNARILVAKINEHIHNQRLDFARNLAKGLVSEYDLIAVEKLNIKGMVKNSRLSKSISDASWSMFIQCLSYKAEEAGKTVIRVNPAGTSQDCSSCGFKVKKDLSVRIHSCPDCGLIIDRDHNAAINILQKARFAPGLATEVSI